MAKCIRCGCTDLRACGTPSGACYWVSEDPPICSACITDADPMPEEEVCPRAGDGRHYPFFRADQTCFCLRCHQPLIAEDAA